MWHYCLKGHKTSDIESMLTYFIFNANFIFWAGYDFTMDTLMCSIGSFTLQEEALARLPVV
jgi:hypothetical protein